MNVNVKPQIDNPRFDGGGLVVALVSVGCFIAGLVVGGFLSTVLL